MISFATPALGLHPYAMDYLIGRVAKKDTKVDEYLTEEEL